jgi:hypothetical protein
MAREEKTPFHLTPDGWIAGDEGDAGKRPPGTVLTVILHEPMHMYGGRSYYTDAWRSDDPEAIKALEAKFGKRKDYR